MWYGEDFYLGYSGNNRWFLSRERVGSELGFSSIFLSAECRAGVWSKEAEVPGGTVSRSLGDWKGCWLWRWQKGLDLGSIVKV